MADRIKEITIEMDGDATDHEELEDEGDRDHDRHLVESGV
jgi:hypothetical protein